MAAAARQVQKQTVVSVPPETAWNGWVSVAGVTSFFAPKANIDARVGGLYELFFENKAPRGFQGTEGCRILKLEPQRNLTFEFIAPPQFPNVRRVRTRVDVIFEEVLRGGLVKVSVIHSGFGEGEEWDASFDFFNWSWELVLGRFQHRFAARSIDWNHPYFPPGIAARPPRKLRDHVSA